MFSFQPIRLSYYGVFIYRIFIVLVLYMLCRFLFYFLNTNLLHNITRDEWVHILRGGLVFDIAAMFYMNSLFIVLTLLPFRFIRNSGYQKAVKYVFFFSNGIALLLNCIDFIYYRFTLRRTTLSVISEFSNETNKTRLAGLFFIDYWYVVLIFIALVLLMVRMYKRVYIRPAAVGEKKGWFYIKAVLILALAVFLAIGGIRGDYKHSTRPITISNAGEYVNRPEQMYLVLNTPFCLIRTWGVRKLQELHYFSDEEAESIYTPVHIPVADSLSFKKENVVIILLESFSKEAVGAYNKDLDGGRYTGYTPFLDSLIGVSKIYWNSFANGRKSIDALPSVLAGIPGGQDPFILTPYSSDSLRSLPRLLKEEGYHTSFFHGAPNGSMGFKALIRMLGIENYYGKDEYNNDEDFDGIWGIWDEPFLQYFSSTLSSFKQPFFSTFFSVSSHHPFKVPEQYTGQFKKGPIPVLECIGYTDMALRKFFESAAKTNWFRNTLFVISADHSTEAFNREYQNARGDVAIPIVLYHPGDSTLRGADSSGVIQQIDLMPGILSYLHYQKPYLAFGEPFTGNKRLNFAVTPGNDYRWIENEYLLFFDGKQSKALFNYRTDRFLEHNLLEEKKDTALQMERHLKAFLQQYNNRLIKNNLVVK
ncbi:MAG: sulfatase-like hydrolase/transferase [Chitinophagaceae bacterium]|nr:sulfatase-like hydrolase/transferase [Chitinophagaceae bacterium]